MKVVQYLNLFKNRNFLLLWSGQLISELGDRFTQMALIASVYYGVKEGRILQLGTLLTFTIIPVFIIGPVAGSYVDRWNRKYTMICTDIIRAILVATIPFLLFTKHSLFLTYIMVFIIFSVTRFFLPAKLGIIPDIVKKGDLLTANSLITTSRLATTIAGLGFGGIIVEMIGVRMGFYLDSITYLLSAMAILLISFQGSYPNLKESIWIHGKRIKEIEKNIFYDILQGLRYIIRVKEIPYVLRTFFILMSGVGAIYVILIDFVLKNLSSMDSLLLQHLEKITGFGEFGLMITFLGMGAFTGTVVFGKWGQDIQKSTAVSLGFSLTGILLILFTYLTHTFKNFWLSASSGFLLGGSFSPVMVIGNTLLHEVTSSGMRGRVFSILEIVIHLGFFLAMCTSILLVEKFHLQEIYILYGAGLGALLYGGITLLKE